MSIFIKSHICFDELKDRQKEKNPILNKHALKHCYAEIQSCRLMGGMRENGENRKAIFQR
jgi:hypothetical protein